MKCENCCSKKPIYVTRLASPPKLRNKRETLLVQEIYYVQKVLLPTSTTKRKIRLVRQGSTFVELSVSISNSPLRQGTHLDARGPETLKGRRHHSLRMYVGRRRAKNEIPGALGSHHNML